VTSARALTRIGATARGVVSPADFTQPPQTVTQLPAKVDLAFYQGDYFAMAVQVTQPDGSALDISSAAPRSQVRSTPNDPEILAEFTCTYDPDVTGLIHMVLLSTETDPLPPRAVWDLQLTIPVVLTIAAGTVTVVQQVTRP
jgi:hypothetical protein